MDHPTGTALLQNTWVVADAFGNGEANCDYVVGAVRSGIVSLPDLERYARAGMHVYVPVPATQGFRSLTEGPPLPPLPVHEGPTTDQYLVVTIDDTQDAGWDIRCW